MSSSQPSRREVAYDYTPFLSSTTITTRLSPLAGPSAIPIPETTIVSPLAGNIKPHILLDLKDFLTGVSLDGSILPSAAVALNGRWMGPGSSLGREKGEEIWKTWKRAYDLWNGFYIEGRVDPVWVREEYETIKKELEEKRNKRVTASRAQFQLPTQDGGEDWSTEVQDGRTDQMDVEDDEYAVRGFADRTPPEPKLRSAKEVAKEDGSTGGFMPMKLLPEYMAPDTDEGGNYPEGWEDVLASTVWRPRRTGEKDGEIEVGIDEPWGKESEFEFDSGVDCGRSPYPCLRYVVEYVRREGCFLKKKVWDKVTGTIFNMPTLPANPNKITDQRRIRMTTLFGDFYRDKAPQHRNSEYFPLDIRRIDKVNPFTGKRHAGTPLLEDEECVTRWPWNNPEGTLPYLDKDDPWYVTDEQQERQLVPPRKFPPGKQPCANGDTLLPTDDTIWKEEIENDEMYRSQYFVTNLHGGPLVINGQEVKLGEIAGPLPEFAIIETPGNQVSFWFGPQGRNWRGDDDNPRLYTSQWRTMRRNLGWENAGLTAGQVWDMKIRDRLRREYIGAEQNDDAQWAEWKTAVTKGTPPTKKTSPLDAVIWDGRYGPSPAEHKQTPEEAQLEFCNELEELEWLVTKANPLKEVTSILEEQNIIQPLPKALWPGPETSEGPAITHPRNSKTCWDARRDDILQQQRDMNAKLAEKRIAQATEKKQHLDAENKKRKAESFEGPAAKRARTEAEAEYRGRAEAQNKKDRDAHQRELDRQITEAENRKVAEEAVQHDARVAAATREAIEADKKRLASLEEAQRRKAEEKIAARVQKEEAAKKRQEEIDKERRIKELNKERAEQGLNPEPEISPRTEEEEQRRVRERSERLARQEAQRKADELKKQLEMREAQRKKAEREKQLQEAIREKQCQEAERQRKQAEQQKKDSETALKNAKELDEARKATAAKLKADKIKADKLQAEADERQRQQFIKQNADRKRKAEMEKARAEEQKQAKLFKDKYGELPTKDLKLDDMGVPLDGQGRRPPGETPPGKSSSDTLPLGDLTGAEIAQLNDAQLQQWLDGAFSGKPTSSQTLTYEQQQLEIALGKSLEDANRAAERDAIIASMSTTPTYLNALASLEQRAKSEGVTELKYAQDHGFATTNDYMLNEIRPDRAEDYPTLLGDRNLPRNVLLVHKYTIRRDAREGLDIRARLENRSVDDIVREKGYTTLREYLLALEDSLNINDIPADSNNHRSWIAFAKRVTDAGEWNARIRTLPALARPQIDKRTGLVFAEL